MPLGTFRVFKTKPTGRPREPLSPLKKAFRNQRDAAKVRGIAFLLTFEEWHSIWLASNKLHLRGCTKGCYVMARYGDEGPYAKENVKIIRCEDNHSEGNLGKPRPKSAAHRAALSAACLGRPSSNKGRVMSEEQKLKLSRAQSRYQAKKREAAQCP